MMTTGVQTDPSKAAHAPARVLVVDDERSMRELLSIVLRRDGYEVRTADDGAAAVELLKKQRFDILITDIRMPQMNGVDLLREAKKIAPDIVSIVMTAFATTDTAVEARPRPSHTPARRHAFSACPAPVRGHLRMTATTLLDDATQARVVR